MSHQNRHEAFQIPVGSQGAGLNTEEVEITRLIHARLQREGCLEPADRETLAYRISEIMVTAKKMYTQSLPRLTNVYGESDASMDDDLEGLRMTFVHMCDLMQDFDSTFFNALGHSPEALHDARFHKEEEEGELDEERDQSEED